MFTAEIIVNGKTHTVNHHTQSYRDVVALAGFHGFPDALTVTYRWSGTGGSGTMRSGESVLVKDGTIFDVADTSRA